VSYWRLGESSGTVACDSAGSNSGVYQTGTTLGQPGAIANDPDTAVAFNGTSGWVQVPGSSSLNVGDRFSIEAWVRRGSVGTAASQVIASKQNGDWVLLFNSSNQLVLRRSNVADVVASTVAVTDTSRWHYVVATKDGSSVHLYLDGVDVTGTVSNQTMVDNTLPLSIGQSSSGAWFNGTIDEVALYNVALTPAQVSNHYSAPPTPPSNTALPTISGTPQAGQTLTANPGSWSGTAPISYAYQWSRCDSSGANCVNVFAATGTTYALGPADLGSTVRVVVTASNSAGSATTTSPQTAVVEAAPAAPTNTSLPTVSGTAQAGQTLTATSGTWSGTAPISYAYQWQRCDLSGGNCVNIAGASNQSYVLVPADVGATVRIAVTASNSAGSATATSAQTAVVQAPPAAPTNTSLPTVSGTAQAGQTLTATSGTWSGTAPISFADQWQHCDSTGANCVNVFAATGTTYALGPADIGFTMRVVVTASNSAGSNSASSQATGAVQGAPVACGGLASQTPPSTVKHVVWIWMENHSYSEIIGSSSAPYINTLASQCGLATNYSAVTHPSLPNYIAATSGSPQGITDDNPPSSHPLNVPSIFGQVPSRSFQESMPSNCDVNDAYPYAVKHNPEAYYTPLAAQCATQDVPLSGFNPSSLPAFSFVTPNLTNDMHDGTVAQGDAWLSNFIPTITSTADYNAGNTVVFITWDEDDSSSGNHIATIILSPYTAPGTQSSTPFTHYSLLRTTEELLGQSSFLGNAATATSMSGSFHLASAAASPTNTSAPTLSGGAQAGQTLTATPGSWSGTAPISYAYQWERCDSSGANCANIAGATASTYTAAAADVGSTLVVVVAASNSVGSNSASSAPSPVVQAAPPTNTAPPTISGTPQAGQTLTANPGSWSGTAPISYAYQWSRCDTTGIDCIDISGANGQTYSASTADVGAAIVVRVTASNVNGSGAANSAPTAAVLAPGSPAGDPVIAAAGDIACDPTNANFNGGSGTATACQQQATSNLLFGQSLAAVLPLGDNQYDCGAYSAYLQSYDPSWGRVKSITHPVPGNHEYSCDPAAGGYFQYFGAAAGDSTHGYYSYDIGSWHIIALNSNCSQIGSCGAGSPQEAWLKADLAAHTNLCTLAYWHHPRFTSGTVGEDLDVATFWQDLYNAGVDVVLNGHAHGYERFAPQTPGETYDPAHGIREFVVGTGGEDFQGFVTSEPLSEVRQSNTFGVLTLTLHSTSYDWGFTPSAGQTFSDSGSGYCH
jgi:hypothetical protein